MFVKVVEMGRTAASEPAGGINPEEQPGGVLCSSAVILGEVCLETTIIYFHRI